MRFDFKTYRFVKKWLKYNTRFVVYAAIVAVTGLIFWGAEFYIAQSYRTSAKLLIEQFDKKISYYRNNLGLSKSEISDLAYLIKADTTQYAILLQYLTEHGHNKRDGYILEDGLHLLNQSKDVLEHQLHEIQAEYETLEIWIAIITVVFLVFSFYSFYKTDEIIRDGKEKIRQFDEMGRQHIQQLDMQVDSKIREMSMRGDSLANSIQQDMLQQKIAFNQAFEKMKSDLDFERHGVERDVSEFSTKVAGIQKDYIARSTELEQKVKSLEVTIASLDSERDIAKDSMGNVIVSIEEIKKEMGEIEERLTTVESAKTPSRSKEIEEIKRRIRAIEKKINS